MKTLLALLSLLCGLSVQAANPSFQDLTNAFVVISRVGNSSATITSSGLIFPLNGGSGGSSAAASSPWPADGMFTNLVVWMLQGPAATTNVVFTIATNGVDSNFSATIIGGKQFATNNTSALSISPSTLVTMHITPSATLGNNSYAWGYQTRQHIFASPPP